MPIFINNLPELVCFVIIVIVVIYYGKKAKKDDTEREAQFRRMKDRGTIK